MKKMLKNLTRSNSSFFVPFQIALTTIFISHLFMANYPSNWIFGTLVMYFFTGCLGITLTFHRYLSHNSFKMHPALEYLFTFFGSVGGTGSSIGWVGVHQQHHLHSDQHGDPHSPKLYGWRIFFPSYTFVINKWRMRRLVTNRFHIFIHEYYLAVLIAWGLLIYAVSGLNGLVFLFVGPIVMQIWISVLSNFANHQESIGYRNFDTKEDSNNCWWLALLTWGEGWHNNHHRHPHRSTFAVKWWEIDVTGLVVSLVRKR